jgi:unsaturated rhamnogalacturonyl hydrolase
VQSQSTSQRLQQGISGDWSVRMADSVMKRRPLLLDSWHYEAGVALSAIKQVYLKTQDERYFEYIKRNMDEFINPDGTINTYYLPEYNLDHINQGKTLFFLYQTTGNESYKKAAYLLRKQLQSQPRTSEGGFWHKLKYPHQMWLDGVYMAGPFYAEFAQTFDEPEGFDDVAHQIILLESHACDKKTGLMYHAWDESRNQVWAHPETGCSPNFWGRAFGWYMMAIVDVLDFLPEDHPQRKAIIDIFERSVEALTDVQNPETGLWYQILDRGDLPGNYLEASASCMNVYAIAKAVRKEYIASSHLEVAQKGYQGILDKFIEVDGHGLVHLHWICRVAGLDQYRDGSIEYYLKENVVTDDYKGIGPFIMASLELENF